MITPLTCEFSRSPGVIFVATLSSERSKSWNAYKCVERVSSFRCAVVTMISSMLFRLPYFISHNATLLV